MSSLGAPERLHITPHHSLLPSTSAHSTSHSTYTLLCFLHFLYAEFLGLAILLSSCLRQYNVCSIFCFLSVLNLPSVVYTDSLLSVRSRIPRHLFACLQATFYDLSPLVIHERFFFLMLQTLESILQPQLKRVFFL